MIAPPLEAFEPLRRFAVGVALQAELRAWVARGCPPHALVWRPGGGWMLTAEARVEHVRVAVGYTTIDLVATSGSTGATSGATAGTWILHGVTGSNGWPRWDAPRPRAFPVRSPPPPTASPGAIARGAPALAPRPRAWAASLRAWR